MNFGRPASLFLLISIAAPLFAADSLSVKVKLTDGATVITRTRRELGITLKSAKPATFGLNPVIAKRALERIAPDFHADAMDAKPILKGKSVVIIPEKASRHLNVATTAEIIAKQVASNPTKTIYHVALIKKSAVLTAARLKGMTGLLSTFATNTSENPKRNHNVHVAVGRINGTLLSPKESFSLNKAVGKRTQANGFLTAPVFEDGKKVPGIGGGVSQVSGTLFNAAALAGLQIDSATPHSRPVAYLPVGRDTTASDDGIDLKFTNTSDAPVYIAYALNGRRLRVTLFGKKNANRKISIRVINHVLGEGKVNTQTYRVVRENGKVTAKTLLFSHQYRWNANKK